MLLLPILFRLETFSVVHWFIKNFRDIAKNTFSSPADRNYYSDCKVKNIFTLCLLHWYINLQACRSETQLLEAYRDCYLSICCVTKADSHTKWKLLLTLCIWFHIIVFLMQLVDSWKQQLSFVIDAG
jgi:hypothetical protein